MVVSSNLTATSGWHRVAPRDTPPPASRPTGETGERAGGASRSRAGLDEADRSNGATAAMDPQAARAGAAKAKGASAEQSLTEAELQQVQKLKARDTEVRSHEAAHMAAGGAHIRGGASYAYEQGPDGRSYAVGGEVGIDVSPVRGNPQATIQKMQQVRAAALAPAEPSGADRAVAASAGQAEARAREQLADRGAAAARRYGAAEPGVERGGMIDASA